MYSVQKTRFDWNFVLLIKLSCVVRYIAQLKDNFLVLKCVSHPHRLVNRCNAKHSNVEPLSVLYAFWIWLYIYLYFASWFIYSTQGKGRKYPSLLWVIVRLYGWPFMVSFVQKVIADLIFLSTPLLLGYAVHPLGSHGHSGRWINDL